LSNNTSRYRVHLCDMYLKTRSYLIKKPIFLHYKTLLLHIVYVNNQFILIFTENLYMHPV
jgi:hypothetical protein